MEHFRSKEMLPPDLSWAVALSIAAVFLSLYALLSWYRKRELRRAERADARPSMEDPVPGPAVLAGTVSLAQDEPHAIRVEITQHGKEAKGKGERYTTTWKEKSRNVDARPFYVLHESGRRTRVEPSAEVVLVDAMGETIRDSKHVRRRVALLREGEPVFVEGTLERGTDPESRGGAYRDTQQGWVLRGQGGRMLVSTEGLGAPHRARARRAAPKLASIAGLLCALMMGNFALRVVAGRDTSAEVIDRRHYTTRHKSSTVDHYEVTFKTESGMETTDELSLWQWAPVGARVPVREVWFSSGATRIGHGASLGVLPMILCILAALAALVVAGVNFSNRPWYDKKLTESVPGRL